jgi:predicted ester cyclase
MADARSVVEELVNTFNAHDPAAGAPLFAANVRAITAGGRQLDRPGLQRMLERTIAGFPDLQVTILRWVMDGDTVVTEEVMEGTHLGPFARLEPTGRRVRLPMVHITRVQDGRIVERVAYHDPSLLLRQLDPDLAGC